jgi:glycosyltransferase involved in cell wall biosynthesis
MPEGKPLLSVAMCTYNGERFLRAQMDSIIAQDYRPTEIVVVDDCSSDGTWQILQEYQAQYPQLRVFCNEENLGYIRNFERALSLCRGDYIALADQDDIWLPNKLRVQLARIGSGSMTYSTLSFIDEEDKPVTEVIKSRRLSGRCHLGLLFHTCVTGHLMLISRRVLERALPFPDTVNAHDRWIPFVAAALDGIHASDDVLSHYRVHSANVSRQKRSFSPRGAVRKLRSLQSDVALERRLLFLQNCLNSDLLAPQEQVLVAEIHTLSRRLRYSFYSLRLRRLLLEHGDALLCQYRDPAKAATRLARSKPAYVINFYIEHLLVWPLQLCVKLLTSPFRQR